MKTGTKMFAVMLIGLAAFAATGCVTARGRKPVHDHRAEKAQPIKRPPHYHR